MIKTDRTKEMERLAVQCMELGYRERPEVVWLKARYLDFMDREGIHARGDADRCLYERMYGKAPERQQDILKIRYWRTGRHLPVSHMQCTAFGRALGLSREEMRYLLQGYYDSCDTIFEEEPPDNCSVYWRRREAMKKLTEDYLQGIPRERLDKLRIGDSILEHNIRHLYYTDACGYVHSGMTEGRKYLNRHITSAAYDSEFSRSLRLLGVIPRKTMIRHLLILGMPQVRLEWMNEQLASFGYLELQEQHTLRGGERLDWLLIRLLGGYEEYCQGRTEAECRHWMRSSCRALDHFFEKEGRKGLRFMYFKALKE